MSSFYVRSDGRANDEMREVKITRNFLDVGEGSVLVEFGNTKVLCVATFDSKVPRWLLNENKNAVLNGGKARGWVTAEYAMLPRATDERNDRESVKGKIGGRTHEISRLIGRALRGIIDIYELGENQVHIDCDVLQADGGTRTASITGAFVALKDALDWAKNNGKLKKTANVLKDSVSAVSVGIVNQTPVLDLPYTEDSTAETDMNVVMTGSGKFIEIQGTAEGEPFDHSELVSLLKLAEKGNKELAELQKTLSMTPELLAEKITEILRKQFQIQTDSLAVVERPKNREHGDWATNAAMQFLKLTDFKSPREFAEELAKLIVLEIDCVEKAEIAGPGFINLTLSKASSAGIINDILNSNESFGKNDELKGLTINLEFVSANPTGPLHIGGTRWAAVGDSLARILEFSGSKVIREYYFNDHGEQINRFARSLFAAANNLETPADGYAGSYIQDIASEVVEIVNKPVSEITEEEFRKFGVEIMFPAIKESLENFRVRFDKFFHEQSLYDDGLVQEAIEKLRESDDIYEKDGAVWVATSKYGDDKDRVVIKSDKTEAYFAADIAYYLEKRKTADIAIYMLGADHGGYIGRLQAICAAFGDKQNYNMQIMLGQLVNLKKNGEAVKMSKRAGNVITIEDLVEAVGIDAARYSLARSSTDQTLDLDLDLLASRTNENPVYYVQYAFARTKSVQKNFETLFGKYSSKDADLSLLDNEFDEELISKLMSFGSVVKNAANLRAVHKLAHFLEDLAAAYHSWYANTKVIVEDQKQRSLARVLLNDSVSIVLRNGLNLLGVNAPERM